MVEYIFMTLTGVFSFLNYYFFALILNKIFSVKDNQKIRVFLGTVLAVIMVGRLSMVPKISILSYIVFFFLNYFFFIAFYKKQSRVFLLMAAAYVSFVSVALRTFFASLFYLLNDYDIYTAPVYWHSLTFSCAACFLFIFYGLKCTPDSSWPLLIKNKNEIKLTKTNLFVALFCLIINVQAYHYIEECKFLYFNLLLLPLSWLFVISFNFYAMLNSAQKDAENRTLKKDLIFKKSLEKQTLLAVEFNCTQHKILNYAQNNISFIENTKDTNFTYFHNKLYDIVDHDYQKLLDDNSSLDVFINYYNSGITEINRTVKIWVNVEYRWTTFLYNIWKENNDIIATLSILDNIHDIKMRELMVKKDAEKDLLVGLYNKKTTEYYIEEYLKEHKNAALFLIDLDNFKPINDSFGHAFGDNVLIEVSEKIKAIFRTTDIIGRIGGDEFCILAKEIYSVADIKIKADRLVERIEHTYQEEDTAITLSCSVGIALAPMHGTNFYTLYQNADMAMYSIKKEGKNGHALYTENMVRVTRE